MTNRLRTWVIRLGLAGASLSLLAACGTTSPYSGAGQVETKGPQPTFPVRQAGAAPSAPSNPAIASAQPPAPNPDLNPPAPAPTPAAPPTETRPSGEVSAQPLAPLAPPPEANPPAPAPAPAQVVQAPPREAAPPPPPPPPPAPIYREIANGPVIEVDGPPASHTVRRGDTLSSIARAMDTTVKDLQTRNKLGNSTSIRPGQRLKGPSGKVKAYVVQQGDTLAAIGRRFSVTTAQLTRSNSLPASGAIRPAQRLTLPSGYRDTGPQRIEVNASGAPVAASLATLAPQPRVATPPAAPSVRPPASGPAAPPPASASLPPALPAPTSAVTLAQGRGQFIWPVEGRTIGAFGSRGPGQVSDGIDIAAAAGAEVRAAAAGTVRFAGPLEETLNLGNLVLIENNSGFYSIYGHLDSMAVRPGDRVTQGQSIGRVGSSGVVSEPELYFELRHQVSARDELKPVDPADLLPRR